MKLNWALEDELLLLIVQDEKLETEKIFEQVLLKEKEGLEKQIEELKLREKSINICENLIESEFGHYW